MAKIKNIKTTNSSKIKEPKIITQDLDYPVFCFKYISKV